MGTIVALRPTGNVSGGGAWAPAGGAASEWQATSDQANGTYMISSQIGQAITFAVTDYTPPANKVIGRYRVGIVMTLNTVGSPKVKITGKPSGSNVAASVLTTSAQGTNITRYGPWVATYPLTQAMVNAFTIQVVDQSGAAGNQQIKEVWVELDVLDDPTVTVTGPSEGSTVSAGRPTLVWDYSDGDGDPQSKADVAIVPSAVYSQPGWDPQVVWEDFDGFLDTLESLGGWGVRVVGSESTVQVPPDAPLLPPGTYRAFVQVAHTAGATSAWSTVDWNTFTINYVTPPTPTVTIGAVNVSGPLLTVAGAAVAAGLQHLIVRLQRSEDAGVTWHDLPAGYGAPANFGVSWNTTFRDRQAEAGYPTHYRAQVLGYDSTNGVWVAGQWSAVVNTTMDETTAAIQGWTFWSWTKTGTATLGAGVVEGGPTYETGTWRKFDVLVADGEVDWSEAPAQELVATPLGRERAVVVSSHLAGAEGDLAFLIDHTDTTNTLAELKDLMKAEHVLARLVPDGFTSWIHWVGDRNWIHGREVREVTVGYVETDPPVVDEA